MLAIGDIVRVYDRVGIIDYISKNIAHVVVYNTHRMVVTNGYHSINGLTLETSKWWLSKLSSISEFYRWLHNQNSANEVDYCI